VVLLAEMLLICNDFKGVLRWKKKGKDYSENDQLRGYRWLQRAIKQVALIAYNKNNFDFLQI
jgi:outer membrane receptor for ferrienterochelin and colicins